MHARPQVEMFSPSHPLMWIGSTAMVQLVTHTSLPKKCIAGLCTHRVESENVLEADKMEWVFLYVLKWQYGGEMGRDLMQ